MDYTVHGILQARILEWVAVPFSTGSSQPRDRTQVSHIAGRFFTSWATKEALSPQRPGEYQVPISPGFSVAVTKSAHKAAAFLHAPRFLSFFFFFFEFLIFYQSRPDFRCRVCFWCTGTWFSYIQTYVYSFVFFSHIDYHSVFSWLPVLFSRSFLIIYLIYRSERRKWEKNQASPIPACSLIPSDPADQTKTPAPRGKVPAGTTLYQPVCSCY